MGHNNEQKFTTFFLLILILALSLGVFTIFKNNFDAQYKAKKERSQEVKGDAKSVVMA